MPAANPKVDEFLAKPNRWNQELLALRSILLTCHLSEEFKWYKPVYMFENSNLIAIAGLKDHCWLMFFKGALLKDPDNLLVAPGENSQSQKVMKFSHIDEIISREAIIRAYVAETIEAEKQGLKVNFSKSTNLIYPDELVKAFSERPELNAAFLALTPGRQRAYNMHFTQPKQAATRAARIENTLPGFSRAKASRTNDRLQAFARSSQQSLIGHRHIRKRDFCFDQRTKRCGQRRHERNGFR